MQRQRKRIVLITDFTGYSGTKTYFLLLSDYLLRKGYHLEVYLASRDSLSHQEYIDFKSKPITFHYLPKILLTNNSLLKRLRIDKLLQFLYLLFLRSSKLFSSSPPHHSYSPPHHSVSSASPERVIVSTGHPFSFLGGAWLWGKKFVYIQHTYPQGSPSRFTIFIAGFRSVYHRLLAGRGMVFITVSEASKKINQKLLCLSEEVFPVEVVYTPCQLEPGIRKSGDNKTIVTCGHLEKWKNPEFWLKVAIGVVTLDPDVVFIWAGTGNLMNDIRNQIPEQFKERILLVGYVEQVGAILSDAVLYFQPSLVESQCISVAEAMAHSLPCVVSNRGGLPESVEDGKTGYVIELNVEQAVQKILFLVTHPEVAQVMGQAGYEKYRQNFTPEIWEKNMDRLLFDTATA